jgi:hypothetical protein
MSERLSNRVILDKITDDLHKLKNDTAMIKLDLKVILAKIESKKQEEKKKEADGWWLASFR